MKSLLFLLSFILVSGFFVNHAYAVKKYNASKSNTSAMSISDTDFTDQVKKAVDNVKEDVAVIAAQMLSQEQLKTSVGKLEFEVKIKIIMKPVPGST